ncbi:hypothetical protein EPN29_12105 [bacterium]|nr:MAG: hypothetical protein EPN29_12105 [bacterium]
MNGTSPRPATGTPAMPRPTAPASPMAAAVHRTALGISVRSGRPFSSSSAWAEMPTARKKASSVAARRTALTDGARLAPMTT